MAADFALPDVEFTVDDLSILPDGCRYELIDGRLDLWDRAPILDLAGLALMAALKLSCLPGFRVAPRPPLWSEADARPLPDLMVTGPGGDRDIRLVVDVRRPSLHFAAWLERAKVYADLDVPCCWLFESPPGLAAELTVFRRDPDGSFTATTVVRDAYATDDPFPVTVDLAGFSRRWPQALEYVEHRDSAPGAE